MRFASINMSAIITSVLSYCEDSLNELMSRTTKHEPGIINVSVSSN